MAEPLTPIERRVYQYLIDFLAENTYQPSIREIGKRFRIKSTKTVSDLLQSLAEKGYIERDPSRSRGVRIIGFQSVGGTQPVPYYGKIAAGEPATITENRVSFLSIDRRFVPSEQSFFLRAKGDSMVGKGILDGDYLMVNPTAQAAEGDIVAARVGEEATVKTLTHQNGTVVLKAENSTEPDVIVQPESDLKILGVVSGVFRSFYDEETMAKPVGQTS
jgi:repressor LexA